MWWSDAGFLWASFCHNAMYWYMDHTLNFLQCQSCCRCEYVHVCVHASKGRKMLGTAAGTEFTKGQVWKIFQSVANILPQNSWSMSFLHTWKQGWVFCFNVRLYIQPWECKCIVQVEDMKRVHSQNREVRCTSAEHEGCVLKHDYCSLKLFSTKGVCAGRFAPCMHVLHSSHSPIAQTTSSNRQWVLRQSMELLLIIMRE